MVKLTVYQALRRLSDFLAMRGADVRYVYLPPGPGGVKVGLDDFLAAGGTVEDLLSHATDELRSPPEEVTGNDDTVGPYKVKDGRIPTASARQDGELWLPLAESPPGSWRR